MKEKIVTFLIFFGLLPNLNFGQHPVLISDFYEGPGNGITEKTYTTLGDHIILSLYSEETGLELGILKDGELSILKDIFPGDRGSRPRNFFNYKNKVYFQANPNTGNYTELWVTDGTEEGTELFHKESASSNQEFYHIISDQDILYFAYSGSLYKYDSENKKSYNETVFVTNNSFYHNGEPFSKYKGEIIFVNFDGSLYQTDNDQLKLLGKVEGIRSVGKYFGLNPVKEGIMFGVRDFNNSSVEYLHLFSEKDSTIYKITTPISKEPRSLVGIGNSYVLTESGDGYYAFSGIDEAPEKIYSTNESSVLGGQRLHFYTYKDKFLYIKHRNTSPYTLVLLHSDTSFQNVNILELPDIIPNEFSNGIIQDEKLYIIKGIGPQQYKPVLYEIDMETGSTIVAYQFEVIPGSQGGYHYSFDLIDIIDNKLYFTSNFNEEIGNELYYLDLSTLVNNEEASFKENSFIRTMGNSIKIEAPNHIPVDVEIYNIEGRIVKRVSTYTNTVCELNLPMGIYIINASVNSIRLSEKILIR